MLNSQQIEVSKFTNFLLLQYHMYIVKIKKIIINQNYELSRWTRVFFSQFSAVVVVWLFATE